MWLGRARRILGHVRLSWTASPSCPGSDEIGYLDIIYDRQPIRAAHGNKRDTPI
ncbi:hypothetical protein MHM582_0613 [Microbacterium sp. HM58-2]|nr:hypothetical protein MHM582_0613 [Microbacterium sp. HM58-2]